MLTGLVLAGGASRRMGRDKARLPLPGWGTLLERQVAVLREAGATRVLVSTQRGRPYNVGDKLVFDDLPDAGPLAGVAAGLREATAGLVLVLAVDMPGVGAGHFAELLCHARQEPPCGVVPVRDRIIEPLTAIYPAVLAGSAEKALRAGQSSPRDWAKAEAARGNLLLWPAPSSWHTATRSWNTPADPDF